MSFEKLYKRSAALTLTDTERKAASVLIVEPEPSIKNSLRQMLTSLGFPTVADALDHAQALKKYEERPFTHVIFEAKKTNMPPREFLTKVLELDNKVIAIPSSWNPNVDDVFDLLIIGARGYLVKPFTSESVDDSMVMASKGEAISDAILYAKNRNEALGSLMLTAVDRLATTIRQGEQFETAQREIPRRLAALRRAADIGKTFADGGPEALLEALMGLCVERGDGPATKLGRIRRRLDERKGAKKRTAEEKKDSEDATESEETPTVPHAEP